VPVSTLVGDAQNALQPLYRERDVTLRVEGVREEQLVHVDPVQVGRALRNVLTNAAQHAPAASTVVLQVVSEGELVTVRVTDAGPGIDAEDLPHVFERFYRADPSRSSAVGGGGSGIGLTIARELLLANGGSIAVETTGPAGTTFVIGLPASA
jgi:two-component system sensor histidine kinase BaeS